MKRVVNLFNEFFNSEKAGGFILILATLVSLMLANSAFKTQYVDFWQLNLAQHSLTHWINDGLMTLFFLLIGLELENEIYQGELKDIKRAAFPLFAALGGMLIPAGVYLLFNIGGPAQSGIGIPMATDIAFAIGILSLLGNKVPTSLKIFLTAFAVIDDLGAIIIIALFYTSTIAFLNLAIALCIFGLLLALNKWKVYHLAPYIIGGIAMWYFMLHSGVHATITGVLLAFAIPFTQKGEHSPSYKLQHFLHKPIAFVVLPLFALANTAITLSTNWQTGLVLTSSIGIMVALVVGKPIGIVLFTYIASRLGFCSLPSDLKWKNIIAVGFLGGIGFTMSIFITLLAFTDSVAIDNAKIAILVASFVAGCIGLMLLAVTLKRKI